MSFQETIRKAREARGGVLPTQPLIANEPKTPIPQTIGMGAKRLWERYQKMSLGAVEKTSEFFQEAGRGFLRSTAAMQDIGMPMVPGQKKQVFTPRGEFQTALYGTDKPITFRSIGEEILPEGSKYAPPVGFALSILDFIPGGKDAAVQAYKKIASVTDEKSIVNTLKELSPTFAKDEQITQTLAKDLVNKNKVVDVQKAVEDALKARSNVQNVTQPTRLPVAPKAPVKTYQDEGDLSTKLLAKLEGKTTVSKQFISDLTNSGDLKQSERDLFRRLLEDEGDKINVTEFANKVKSELLPLKRNLPSEVRQDIGDYRYESVNLPEELRGSVANYSENIYQSSIKTSAGNVHFGNEPNYFAHTRVEDMADGTTRRVIEAQSDLFQKGRLESEFENVGTGANRAAAEKMAKEDPNSRVAGVLAREKEIAKLEPYRNTWHERIIREEVKKAAQDGKTKLQFPTGETAMKIEGLGQANARQWGSLTQGKKLTPDNLRVGDEIVGIPTAQYFTPDVMDRWIITDVLGDGKFKAVPKYYVELEVKNNKQLLDKYGDDYARAAKEVSDAFTGRSETFDISGKVDQNNPIYKFYEKEVGKYLKNKYNAQLVTDAQGVKWWEVNVDPRLATKPTEAFGVLGGVSQDEEGNFEFNPLGAALGVAGMRAIKNKATTDTPKSQFVAQGAQDDVSKQISSEKAATKGIEALQEADKSPSREAVLDAFNARYTAGAGKARDLDKAIVDSAITTSEPKVHKEVTSKLKKAATGIIEFVQDTDRRVLELQRNKNVVLDENSDIYLRMTLMPGRLDTAVTTARAKYKDLFADLGKYAKANNVDYKLLRKEINDYLWLKHAPERNAKLGEKAAGITTENAQNVLSELSKKPEYAKVQEAANELLALHKESLKMLKDSEVISEELFNTLTDTYKNHVPLYRVMENEEDFGMALSARGFDVRSTGIKRAKGSEREVSDVAGNILFNFEQAAIRSEKNIVDLATLQFTRKNSKALDNLIAETKLPVVPVGKTTQDGIEKALFARQQFTNDPSILSLREKGKPVFIKIKDENLAIALKGTGREKLGTILNVVGAFTRFYSGLATRFNPEFAFPNKLRDLQETMVYMAAQKGVGAKGAVKTAIKDPASIKHILDAVRGVDSEGARLYAEMKRYGGTTGGMGLSTKKQVNLDISKLDKLAQSSPRKYAEKLIEYVDDWNTLFEDSTRLSVYKTALEQGFSKDRAAFFAKEASINFNRMGKGGPVINALWMFANASIQGSTKMIRAMKNPKVAASVAVTVGGAVAALHEWNDRVDPDWRQNVSKWDKLNSLPLALPSEDGEVRYINIPVSWGIKPIKVMADYAYESTQGAGFDVKKMSEDLFTSVADAYNPLGGSDWVSAAVPTILDIPVEIARNLKWSGQKIKPDIDPYAPASIQYFESLSEKASGRASISLTEQLASYGVEVSPADIQYAYEQYVGGAGRFVTKLSDTAYGVATGDLPPISEFPFIARFYKEKQADEVFNTEANDAVRKLNADEKKRSFYLKRQAQTEWDKMAEMDKADKKEKLKAIAQDNPQLAEKIMEIAEEEKLNLSGTEKQLKNSPVQSRAQYIANELQELKTKEEKRALLKEYAQKKILTDAVLDRLIEIIGEKP